MTMFIRRIAQLLIIFIFAVDGVTGQSTSRAQSQAFAREIESPARPGSAESNLYAAGGRVFLSWIEPAGEGRHALRFAVRKTHGWSSPQTVSEGDNWFVNWADFPSLIALSDGALAAHWLVKSGTGAYSYDVNIARSADGGVNWSKPLVPHRDGTKTEHGFVSMLALPGGRIGAAWLDGRNMKEGGHEGHGPSVNEMTLRYATIDSRGRLSEEALLDSRVCECCQTDAALTSEGAIVVYRDRTEREVRDISYVRFHKGRWSEPRTVHADNWQIEGCPVNGPAVAARGRRVAVAWFTAAANTARVKVSFSSNAGATFGPPLQVDEGSPAGRVSVEMLSDGSALVVWLERNEIKARRVHPGGKRGAALTIAESSGARASGFPRIARAGDEIIFAWTAPGKPSRVRTAVLNLRAK